MDKMDDFEKELFNLYCDAVDELIRIVRQQQEDIDTITRILERDALDKPMIVKFLKENCEDIDGQRALLSDNILKRINDLEAHIKSHTDKNKDTLILEDGGGEGGG